MPIHPIFIFHSGMDISSFYGSGARPTDELSSDDDISIDESSDEDFVEENTSSTDDTSTEDATESDEEDRAAVNLPQTANVSIDSNDWNPVTSSQRQFLFTGKEGICFDIPVSTDGKTWPIDIYRLLLTDDILDMVSRATNEYAKEKIDASHVTRRSRLNAWKETCPDEIMKFFSLILYMGLVHKPEIALYWSKSELYSNATAPKVMTRERFEMLWSMIHFADNTAAVRDTGRLHKIQPFLEKILTNFQLAYEPGEELILDESMVPFRGRLGFRQYLPGKAHKYGMKLYKLCTPEAYTWNIKIHCETVPKKPGLTCTESLTLDMCEKL